MVEVRNRKEQRQRETVQNKSKRGVLKKKKLRVRRERKWLLCNQGRRAIKVDRV